MGLIRFVFALGLGLLPVMAAALDLRMPATARQTAERTSPFDGYEMPVAGFDGTGVPHSVVEGEVRRRTWRMDGGAFTTLQVLAPLRDQVEAAGFEVMFQCSAETCGGFDFRFGTEVVPAPDMHVDIQDFRFVSARHDDGRAASLLVSRSRTALFVQAIDVRPVSLPPTPAPAPTLVEGLVRELTDQGHVILGDLAFATGGAALEERDYDSLRDLAAFMGQNPQMQITLVGHTDSVGDLASNIALSKQRAEAVRARLIAAHGVDPAQVTAEGTGYLAPIGSNLTEAGRKANRRVEAIVLPR